MNSLQASYDMVEPPIINLNFLNKSYFENENPEYVSQIHINNNLNELSIIEEDKQETNDDIIINKTIKDKAINITENLSIKQNTLKGSESFEKAFTQAAKEDPSIIPYKNFLVRTAKRESNFNSSIQNKSGAPYYGYFQFGEAALKTVSNMTMSEFRKDPVAQIKCAVKLYKHFIKESKRIGIYDLAKSKGYSDDAIVSGAWLGGLGGVKKYLKGLGDPSDSHWYGGKGGTSVGKLMEEFK